MDDPILLQKQIRNNAEEMHNYLSDMKQWLQEMKRKQESTFDLPTNQQSQPVGGKQAKQKSRVKLSKRQSDKPKRISSYDYAKWDNFDVDKACEEIDQDDIPEVCVSEEPDKEEKQRLRDQALYEKELGNAQVKKQNWKEAIQYYNRAINCFAYDPTFYANRALCFLKTKEPKSAETDCTTALQLDPTYVKAFVRRATARTELRQYNDAKEDLEKALEFEPSNTVAKSDLLKLEKKLLSSPSKNVVPKRVKKDLKLPPPAAENILNDVAEAPTTSLSNKTGTNEFQTALIQEVHESGSGDAKKNKLTEVPWRTGSMKLVQTIHKPPHLRSKRPLKRIAIQDVCDSDIPHLENKKESCGDNPNVVPFNESLDLKAPDLGNFDQNKEKSESNKITKPSQKLELNSQTCPMPIDDVKLQVPAMPKSSVQFLLAWKTIRSNKKLRFEFLKQIPGNNLPRIFENSLESDIVSDLVSVLASDFLEAGEPVYSYLLGLSSVQRFRALAMFLSKVDKKDIKKLLDHCVSAGECSEEEAERLSKEYEVL